MITDTPSLAQAVTAIETISRAGYLGAALDAFVSAEARSFSSQKGAQGKEAAAQPGDQEAAAQPGDQHGSKANPRPERKRLVWKLVFGAENQRVRIPGDFQTVQRWGQQTCRLRKFSHLNLMYCELLAHEEHSDYLKWVYDNALPDSRYEQKLQDLQQYMCRRGVGFERR